MSHFQNALAEEVYDKSGRVNRPEANVLTGVAAYFYTMELRGLDIETARGEGGTAQPWYMRCIFVLLYHVLVFGVCLSKSAVSGRLQRLDSDNGGDQQFRRLRPSVGIVEELPEV